MKLPRSILVFFLPLATATKADFASQCYTSPLPPLTPSTENRTIPWGSPEFVLPNGTTCCTSLAQVRAGIDDVDAQLLSLLALRAGYVREATRFKSNLSSVDVPARDAQVISDAVAQANTTTPPLPQNIAEAVFTAILNSSVPFEECVFESYEDSCSLGRNRKA